MTREFIYRDLGEFGFNHFYVSQDNKWIWIDLEVDCDVTTLDNFSNDSSLNFQFWISDENSQLNIASNFMGHKRQARIPTSMLTSLRITFLEPAREGAIFELVIESNAYQGEITRGQMSVRQKSNGGWDMDEYERKKKALEEISDKLVTMTGGHITKGEVFINA